MNKIEQNRENWRKLIEEQTSSGLSMRSFCESKKISLIQLYYYRHTLGEQKLKVTLPKEQIVPIHIQSSSTPNVVKTSSVRVTLQNGMQCIFPSDMEVGLVQQWMKVLLSC
jgi:hypothetical protein